MKQIIFCLLLCSLSFWVKGQSKDLYRSDINNLKDGTYIKATLVYTFLYGEKYKSAYIDYGQKECINKWYGPFILREEVFNSDIHLLNFLQNFGFELIQISTENSELGDKQRAITSSFLMRKIVKKNSLFCQYKSNCYIRIEFILK